MAGNVLTPDEKQEFRAWRDKMRERDRAMEPERDAQVVLQELRVALAQANGLRARGYERRGAAREQLRRTRPTAHEACFALNTELREGIGQVRMAEAWARQLNADMREWEAKAADQAERRRERAEQRRREDRDDRRKAGLAE